MRSLRLRPRKRAKRGTRKGTRHKEGGNGGGGGGEGGGRGKERVNREEWGFGQRLVIFLQLINFVSNFEMPLVNSHAVNDTC